MEVVAGAGRSCAADPVCRSGCERDRCRHPAGGHFRPPRTRQGRNFAPERTETEANVFDAVTKHVHALQSAGKRAVIAMWSEGSRERMSHVLADHALVNLTHVAGYPNVLRRPNIEVSLAVLGLETGFEAQDLAVIAEQDILGDRLVRRR